MVVAGTLLKTPYIHMYIGMCHTVIWKVQYGLILLYEKYV
jgi:hypothetical protein